MTNNDADYTDGTDLVVRQPVLRPADMTGPQRELYDAITSGPRSGGAFALTDSGGVLQGPFGGFLLSPVIGDALQQLGAALRYHSAVAPRARELVILTVAAHHSSRFERDAHEAVGRAVGLTEAEIRAVREGRVPALADLVEDASLRFAKSVISDSVDDATWASCHSVLGVTVMYEIIVLVGYYSTLAVQMRVLRTDGQPVSGE
jgi:4-carboxymuconolactone decarboxylase